LICLIPCLIAAFLVAKAYLQEGRGGFRLGVDLVGGTVVVYEVDTRLTAQLQGKGSAAPETDDDAAAGATGTLSHDDMAKLASALKRRIDPADLRNVTIRPVGGTRIEIVLPTGGAKHSDERKDFTQEEIEAVKAMIRQVGNLEFRIVANDTDDHPAIEAAQSYISDAANRDALDRAAREGLVPPFPPGEFHDNLTPENPATYAWVELGQEERQQLGLSNVQETSREPSPLWRRMAEARKKNETVLEVSERESTHLSYLLYSRNCVSKYLSDAEKNEKKYEYFMLTRSSDTVKVNQIAASVEQNPNLELAVGFHLNSADGRRFFEITNKNKRSGPRDQQIARQLAIVLDGYLKSAPRINEPIHDRGQITGNYTMKDAEQLANILRSGALAAVLKPQPVSENTIGATLGADTIHSGTLAVGLAFAAVLVFMVFYYRFAGLVASTALLANLLLTVGFMVAVNATFTLPGLAGLVLMLGMAVDANVLIYERIREERDRGASLPVAIRNGYDRAFGTIIDTHLTSIFTAIVLYAVGNDQLKGFGVSLSAGLVISLFTSLYMTRLIFDYWQHRHWLSKLRMLRFFSRPSINFMRIRHFMFALTATVTILGLALFLGRGEKGLNVDFIGGTTYGGHLSQPMSIKDLRTTLDEERQKQRLAVDHVEPRADPSGKYKNLFVIKYKDGSEQRVSLNNPPLDGKGTTEEQLQNVTERASALPDWSVEQIRTRDSSGDESRYFNVRTTEKEPELVQVAIDRMFREPDGTSKLVTTSFDSEKDGTGYKLTFRNLSTGNPEPTSPSYVKTLLEREFRTALGDKLGTEDPFTLQGLGAPLGNPERGVVASGATFGVPGPARSVEGRFTEMKLEPAENSEVQKAAPSILAQAQQTFSSRPQPERLETFDSTLAAEMRARAFYAILASWLAILLYLWFRFGSWTFGAAAVLCLIHDLCFTLGAIAVCHYVHDTAVGRLLGLQDFKIDLAAVAALLTLVGYSVNEIIVNFARIREVRGKSPDLTPQTINNSVNQTLSRTILTSMTVFLVSIVLYAFGGAGVHLFAFVMLTGVMVSTFSSIYVASPLLLIFGEGRHHGQPAAVRAPQREPAAV
jgi:SecD/SecF fusion protein